MHNVQLIINGQAFPVHYRLLLAIAEHFPEDDHYGELARALAALNVPSVTENLIDSPQLTPQDRDALWAAGDADIRRDLVSTSAFLRHLTDAQAQDIIAADDPDMLESVARRSNRLYPDRAGRQGTRLSGALADALLERVAGSRYPVVRQTLAEHRNTPLKFRPSLRECMESGFSVRHGGFSDLQTEDIDLLGAAARETLLSLANEVESIEDDAARQRAIDLLCAHPDPSVRLELAENRQAPRSALRRLLGDAEPDVVMAARQSLGEDEAYVVTDRFTEDDEDF